MKVAPGDPGEIVDDEHLAVGVRPGANADDDGSDRFRNARGEFARNKFEHEEFLTGGVERQRVVENPRGGDGVPTLSAHDVVMLGFEPEMAAEIDSGRADGRRRRWRSTLEFDAVRAGGAQGSGARQRLRRRIVGGEGQIGDEVNIRRAASYGGDMVGHVGKRHLAFVAIAQDIYADAVADKNNVCASLRLETRGRRVIGGDDRDFRAPALHVETRKGFQTRDSGGPDKARPLARGGVLAGVWTQRRLDFLKTAAFVAAGDQCGERGQKGEAYDFAVHLVSPAAARRARLSARKHKGPPGSGQATLASRQNLSITRPSRRSRPGAERKRRFRRGSVPAFPCLRLRIACRAFPGLEGLCAGAVSRQRKGQKTMPLYEHVYLARQDISPQQVETLTGQFKTIIASLGGTVGKTEYWGVKSLAYRIKKNRKAHFTLLNIDAPPAAIAELERQQGINEDILRVLTLRVEALEEGPSAQLRKRDDDERSGDRRPPRGDRPDRRPRREESRIEGEVE